MADMTKVPLTDIGQTGNNTHSSVDISPDAEQFAFLLVVEAVGATPTITWKIQGSLQLGRDANDASAQWFDIPYITESTATESQAARVFGAPAAGGAQVIYLALANVRMFRRYRLITSSNTNVTYHGEMHTRDLD